MDEDIDTLTLNELKNLVKNQQNQLDEFQSSMKELVKSREDIRKLKAIVSKLINERTDRKFFPPFLSDHTT